MVFSPDGQMLASGSADNTVKLWSSVTGEVCAHPSGPSELRFGLWCLARMDRCSPPAVMDADGEAVDERDG